MNLARVSSNGQITVPVEVRRQLELVAGDKVLFTENGDGDIVLTKAPTGALPRAQAAFAGVAASLGLTGDDDVQRLVDEVRYGAARS
jgi:AbrB family looped-hinge helix DNA binding protein